MRILHIASGDFFSTYGGGQVYVKNIVDQMVADGRDIAVVSSICSDMPITQKIYNGIPLIEINSPDMLAGAINSLSPDLIHAHSLKDNACKIGKDLGIPVVITSHHGGILCPAGTRLDCEDQICHRRVNHHDCLPCVLRNIPTGLRLWYPLMRHIPENIYRNLGKRLSKLPFIPFITPVGIAANSIYNKQQQWNDIAGGCKKMIAPCQEIATAMIENGLDSSKVTVIPHGIPLPSRRPKYPEIINEKVKFYYVGRICYVKGIHTLLEAFHSVVNPAIELHLIGGAGNKHEKRYMNNLKKRYLIDDRIIWHGKIAPETVYKETCNYHVSSSASAFLEAFGLNIAEALALGKPVLATRSGGGEAQIKDGENGWLVPTNNPSALASKIKDISDHPEQLASMSANCHAISIADHCNALYNVYEEVLAL